MTTSHPARSASRIAPFHARGVTPASVVVTGTLLSLLVLGCSRSAEDASFGRLIQVEDAEIERALSRSDFSTGDAFSGVELDRNRRMSVHLVQVLGQEPTHIHAHHDLLLTVRRGSGILRVGQQFIHVVPGTAQVIRRRQPHSIANTGGSPLVLVVYYFPPFDGEDPVLLAPALTK
ncbi:MAG: cupin domain-containing protein [Phycisphaerae bacterium]|nr:cupin domain-containing protein [Phycisphaerae bacterium]